MAQTAQTIQSNTHLPPYKSSLLSACLAANSLTFGTYTLKSGRISPYFFNAGSLHSGRLLSTLSDAFAVTISTAFGATQHHESTTQPQDPGFDVVFGPAYKGIPLACTTVQALARLDPDRYGDVSYCFDRKEVKTHGDGGSVVGAPMKGKRVVVVDDVMTAGTAIRQALNIIGGQGGIVVGVVVALDRQERAPSAAERGLESGNVEYEKMSTIGLVRKEFGLPVTAVLTLDDIIEGYRAIGTEEQIKHLEEYREKYRASD